MSKKKEIPSYYAIIPANVRYDSNLKANEKLMFAEITALCNKNGYCHASNNYFAELYGVSKETVSRWIRNLSKNGYVNIKLIYAEGTNQIINRYVQINQYPIDEKINTPIDEKIKGNSTSNNNTSINKQIGNLQSSQSQLDLPLQTKKEEKKKSSEQKEKSFKQWSESDFKDKLSVFLDKYGKEMLNAFYLYWSEPMANGKMLLTSKKSWDTARRLNTWSRNNFNKTASSGAKNETPYNGR